MSKFAHTLLLLAGTALICGSAAAQSKPAAAIAPASPIELLLEETGVKKVGPIIKLSNGKKMKVKGKNYKSPKTIDHMHLDLGADKARCMEIEQKLTQAYGTPRSTRRNMRIWEVVNSDQSFGQAANVTIMAGEESGGYFVTIDRRGPTAGDNPRHRQKPQTNARKRTAVAPSPRNVIDPNVRD